VLDAGIRITHFDSHQHIHTIPKMFPVLKALQRKFGVKKVRSTINLLPAGHHMTAVRSLKKRLFRLALSHVYSTRSPQGLGDFRDFHTVLRQGYLPKFPCLELMVHPGTRNSGYNDEVNLLRSDWRRLLPPSVRLGSYHSL
jgi:chitin disaccharide deacetylase